MNTITTTPTTSTTMNIVGRVSYFALGFATAVVVMLQFLPK